MDRDFISTVDSDPEEVSSDSDGEHKVSGGLRHRRSPEVDEARSPLLGFPPAFHDLKTE